MELVATGNGRNLVLWLMGPTATFYYVFCQPISRSQSRYFAVVVLLCTKKVGYFDRSVRWPNFRGEFLL